MSPIQARLKTPHAVKQPRWGEIHVSNSGSAEDSPHTQLNSRDGERYMSPIQARLKTPHAVKQPSWGEIHVSNSGSAEDTTRG